MKILRARELNPDDLKPGQWTIVGARKNPLEGQDMPERLDFPLVLEFYDDVTGEVTPPVS